MEPYNYEKKGLCSAQPQQTEGGGRSEVHREVARRELVQRFISGYCGRGRGLEREVCKVGKSGEGWHALQSAGLGKAW